MTVKKDKENQLIPLMIRPDLKEKFLESKDREITISGHFEKVLNVWLEHIGGETQEMKIDRLEQQVRDLQKNERDANQFIERCIKEKDEFQKQVKALQFELENGYKYEEKEKTFDEYINELKETRGINEEKTSTIERIDEELFGENGKFKKMSRADFMRPMTEDEEEDTENEEFGQDEIREDIALNIEF